MLTTKYGVYIRFVPFIICITRAFHGDDQDDGYKSTGCLDLNCDGFVPVNDAPITPGDTLEGQTKISIKIFKVGLRKYLLYHQIS